MAVDASSVHILATSIIEAMTKLNAKERERPVSRGLAENLNKLIALGKEVEPDIDARLWPEPIRISETMGVTQVFASHTELEAKARQVIGLVPRPIFRGTV